MNHTFVAQMYCLSGKVQVRLLIAHHCPVRAVNDIRGNKCTLHLKLIKLPAFHVKYTSTTSSPPATKQASVDVNTFPVFFILTDKEWICHQVKPGPWRFLRFDPALNCNTCTS